MVEHLRVALEHVRVPLVRRQQCRAGRSICRPCEDRPPCRENSKSLRSPSTTTFGERVDRAGCSVDERRSRSFACCVPLRLAELRPAAGRRPNSGSSPPLELKWLATTKIVLPFQVNSPASGLRLSSNAGSSGSMRPGLNVSCGPCAVPARPRSSWSTCRPGGRRRTARGRCGTGSPGGCCRPAAPPSVVVDRVDLPVRGRSVRRPPDRGDQLVQVSLRRPRRCRRPSAPSLSWISSTATRSGALRLLTICSASPSNFDGGSVGARFSTLNVAIVQLVRRRRLRDLALEVAGRRRRRCERVELVVAEE